MKTIAVVANTSWNILNFRSSLIRELQQEFKVLIIAPEDEYSDQVKDLAPTYFLSRLKRKGTNPLQDVLLLKELSGLYRKLTPDVILHFTIKPNIYGSIAASNVGIPSIAVVTGLGYTFLSKGIAARAAKRLYKFAFSKNEITIFQNPDDRQLFLSSGLVNEQKSRVILGSGIDMNTFHPIQKTENHQGFHFLFVGRMLYDKGVRELLQAFLKKFKTSKNVFLHLVGEIDEGNPSAYSKTELNTILQMHKNIIYHGRVNTPNQLIANSDCVVLPSYREGLPRVMLEALAMAKPVITTDVPGCREVVAQNKNGYLVQSKHADELAEAMTTMRNLSIKEREIMGNFGRQLVKQRFSSAVINEQYVKAVKNLL